MKNGIISKTTSGGIEVIVDADENCRSSAYMVAVSTGSRDENDNEWGISHLLEHVVFRATDTYDSYTMAKEMEGAGGMLNAFTGKEMTAFYGITLKETGETAKKFVADILCNPKISFDDTEMEKKIVLQEISMCENDPSSYIHDLFAETMWRGHCLGHNEAGTTDIVKRLDNNDLRRYYNEKYGKSNFTVLATGAVDIDDVVSWAEENFDSMSAEKNKRNIPTIPKECYMHYKRKDDHCYVGMGFPTEGPSDPDMGAVQLLSVILGGGSSSRLFQQVREEKALVYSVYTDRDVNSDAASLGAFFSSTKENVSEAVETVGKVFREVKNGITEDELSKAKNISKGSLVRGAESISRRIYSMAKRKLVFGEVASLEERLEKLDAVTVEDVMRVAEKIIKSDRLNVAMYGPKVKGMDSFTTSSIEL